MSRYVAGGQGREHGVQEAMMHTNLGSSFSMMFLYPLYLLALIDKILTRDV
jgi:hypothetical protein